jgi:hypothetical protein
LRKEGGNGELRKEGRKARRKGKEGKERKE